MIKMEQSFAKRGRLEIIREILTISRKPAKKTSILYKCNLSFSQLQKYLEYLISHNLLANSKNDGKTFYLITEKGIQFIEEYEKLNSLLS
jgi:predicted transcriptional regulator